MTLIAIRPVEIDGAHSFRAVAGQRQSLGKTAGEALDALTARFPGGDAGSLVLVQRFTADRFFDDAALGSLSELMGRWRSARDRGESFPDDEQAGLEALVEAERDASAARAGAIADELGR